MAGHTVAGNARRVTDPRALGDSACFLYKAVGALGHARSIIRPVDQVILRVLAAEVQRRKCPGCTNSLRQADISAHFAGPDKVQLHFRCRFCVFEGGGEIELTPAIYEEAARSAPSEEREGPVAEPISADEILVVHEVLGSWNRGLVELLARQEPTHPSH